MTENKPWWETIIPINFPFRLIQELIDAYPKEKPNKVFWWYRKSDFGLYLIKSIYDIPEDAEDPKTKKEWRKLIPFFKKLFPTVTEDARIKHNVRFLSAMEDLPQEDYYFMRYVAFKALGSPSIEDIDNMNYKDFLILYGYMMGEIYLRNIGITFMKGNILNEMNKTVKNTGQMVT